MSILVKPKKRPWKGLMFIERTCTIEIFDPGRVRIYLFAQTFYTCANPPGLKMGIEIIDYFRPLTLESLLPNGIATQLQMYRNRCRFG